MAEQVILDSSTNTPAKFPRIDYTARDFESIKSALIDFIKVRFPNDYTDFTEAQVGIMLLELWAWVGDMLSFNIDMIANECFLATAKQRQNVVNIAKLIGYEAKSPAAASVEMLAEATVLGGFPNPATIPKGTFFVFDTKTFELLADYVLPALTEDAGPTSDSELPGPTFFEGKTYNELFVPTTNDPNQFFQLSNFPVIRNSVIVKVNTILWNEVESLVFAGDTDSYSIEFTGNNEAIIRFGDGLSGHQVFIGDQINIEYRVGGGSSGNIPSNVISKTVTATTMLGNVNILLTNPSPASGGADEETTSSIKFNAPKSVRTHGNAITKEDYDFLASNFSDETYGRIAKAVCFPRYGRTNSSANEVDIYVWARDLDGNLVNASIGLKEALLDHLNARKVLVVDLFINNGLLKLIDVDIRIFINESLRDSEEIKNEVDAAIKEYFNRDELQPAMSFYVSELYEVIQSITGVQQTILAVPGSETTTGNSVNTSFVSGLTTIVTLTTPGLGLNEYAGGTIEFTSGNEDGKKYSILSNLADQVTLDGIVSTLENLDSFTLKSQPEFLKDIPVKDNQIYKIGDYTLSVYIRNVDTRESILVGEV